MLDLLFIGKFDCYHVYILYGKTVIIPILLAFLFAVLLLPMAHFFNTKLRFPHALAVSITVILFVSLIIIMLLSLIKLVILQVILLILEKTLLFS
jgi:predicted PurR-regulated permease PerM